MNRAFGTDFGTIVISKELRRVIDFWLEKASGDQRKRDVKWAKMRFLAIEDATHEAMNNVARLLYLCDLKTPADLFENHEEKAKDRATRSGSRKKARKRPAAGL